MFTNTYLPHVGGVARSVSTFADAYRSLGHECLIVAPEFEEKIPDETNVYRVPAITNFNDSGFSFQLPFAGDVSKELEQFAPNIIHAHHPFLLGDSALRSAYSRDLPIVFTHHTLYEEYTNYLPFDSEFTKTAAKEIATGFANTCSLVFAPSNSIAELIKSRGVTVPIEVQPTGIDAEAAKTGNGKSFRTTYGIPDDAPVIGHVGRIAKEKNLTYLVESVCSALDLLPDAFFVLVGSGEQEAELKELVVARGLKDRFIATGSLQGQALLDAYSSFDVFAFASQSETQGLVIAEAMAGGAPVVAVEGPGIGDILQNRKNGILLPPDAPENDFANALTGLIQDSDKQQVYRNGAVKTAQNLSVEQMARHALSFYENAIAIHQSRVETTGIDDFDKIIANIESELQLLKVKASSVTAAAVS